MSGHHSWPPPKYNKEDLAEFLPENSEIIFRSLVGSGLHGLSVGDQDDRDEMGVAIPDKRHVLGLNKFHHKIIRTQPEGQRSGPGDLDLTLYSLEKYMRLAQKGNPSIISLLWVPSDYVVNNSSIWKKIVLPNREKFVTERALKAHLGYLKQQRERVLGIRGGKHTNRPELIEKYGFDTKYAGHMVRLAIQGYELSAYGKINLPMSTVHAQWIKDLRVGKHTLDEAIAETEYYEAELKKAIDNAVLPYTILEERVDDILLDCYKAAWDE